jgi:hypothetical protein
MGDVNDDSVDKITSPAQGGQGVLADYRHVWHGVLDHEYLLALMAAQSHCFTLCAVARLSRNGCIHIA